MPRRAAAPPTDPAVAARRLLGIRRLRPTQRRALDAVVAGRDALVVLETGAGKSAVYQLAGALRGGLTVVVSPLRALQRDQVHGLERSRAGRAEVLNSDLPAGRRRRLLEDVEAGEVAFLFTAPEQLRNEEVDGLLRRRRPGLVAVDEAHCISSWGHDFRPDYLLLGGVLDAWGRPVAVALTATAAPPVRRDIVDVLGLTDPVVVVGGVDRTNLWLGVEHHHDADERDAALVAYVRRRRSGGIVYASTHRRTEELAGRLAAAGVPAGAYHGGLPAGQRRQREDAWLSGATRVVVATSAFGMGIDNPSVRFVAHADPPESLDAYYQEVGRAGRDGRRSDARMFYRAEDLGLARWFAAGGAPDPAMMSSVMSSLATGSRRRDDLVEMTGASDRALGAAVAALAEVRAVQVAGPEVSRCPEVDPDVAVAAVARRAEEREQLLRSRVEMLRVFAETRQCRWRYLSGYFGDEAQEPCGHCDNCVSGRSREAEGHADAGGADGSPFAPGTSVHHPEWGDGEVLSHHGDRIVALFPSGYRTLSLELVERNGLLEVRA